MWDIIVNANQVCLIKCKNEQEMRAIIEDCRLNDFTFEQPNGKHENQFTASMWLSV